MLMNFTVSTNASCVKGHFPGAPVVPGAYLLGRVDTALREAYPEWRLNTFKKVKFMANLLPEQQANITIDVDAWPKLKINVSHGEVLVLRASAVMSLAVPSRADTEG